MRIPSFVPCALSQELAVFSFFFVKDTPNMVGISPVIENNVTFLGKSIIGIANGITVVSRIPRLMTRGLPSPCR